MKSVQPKDIKLLIEAGKTELIDIREPYETNCANIGGHLIPMGEIESHINGLNPKQHYTIMCQSGKRAAAVANLLAVEHGFEQVYILEGGFEAYAKDIDKSIEFC